MVETLLSALQIPAILFHLRAEPALQAGSQRGGKITELDTVLSAFVRPGDASGEFCLSVGTGNGKQQSHRSAGLKRRFRLDAGAARADVQQTCIKAFSGILDPDGDFHLGAIVTLL